MVASAQLTTQQVIDAFHILTYEDGEKGKTWGGSTYFGVKLWKLPSDLFTYQELFYELRPKAVIETGTAFGGSALYFAHLLDQLSSGKVVSVDLKPIEKAYPRHPRIAYFGSKSSVDPEVLEEVARFTDDPTVVILDSDHSKKHVLAELDVYSRFVPPGSWLIVEDTNINGHPVRPTNGAGPYEALAEWLPKHPDFVIDERKATKYMFSMNTWLRRRRI